MDTERIIAEAKRQHLSVRELAERSGVSKSTLYRIRNHQVTPDTATMQLLAEALRIAPQKKMPKQRIWIYIDFYSVQCYKRIGYVQIGHGRRHGCGLRQMRKR